MLQKESLGPKKSLKSLQLSLKIKVLLFSALIVFGPRFGTLLGSFWEGIWPQAMLKPVSSVASGRPRAVSNYFFGPRRPPRALQEASKSAPYVPGSPRLAYQAFSRAPRGLQDAYKRPLGPIWQPCWYHVGAIFQPIQSDVAAMLVTFPR